MNIRRMFYNILLFSFIIAMKLPILKATSFNHIIQLGGHSKPWIVSTLEGSYVTKLYKTIDLEARNKMTAEVLGNLLAKEFDFNVPKAAIIEFDDNFRMSLGMEEEEILSTLDERSKFGSLYLNESYLYSPLTNYPLEGLIAMDTLYAFDYFICNRDRTQLKPNLLIKDNEAILIDHEMALEINQDTTTNFNQDKWDSRYKYHLFYERLKSSTNEEKKYFFTDFLFYLQELRWNKFEDIFVQLQDLGFEPQKETLKAYFNAVCQNPDKYVNILKKSIE